MGVVEVDKLHEEGDVEQDRLGVGEAQGECLGEVALAVLDHGRLPFPPGDEVGVQDLHPEIEQIEGPQVAHQGKQQGGGTNEGGDAQISAEDQDGVADEDPEGRLVAGADAAARPGAQHINRVGPRRYDDEEEPDQISPDIDDTQALKHGAPPWTWKTARSSRSRH